MRNRVDPIGFADIVNSSGKATNFFARNWQNLVNLVTEVAEIEGGLVEVVERLLRLENAEIIAGTGLSGGGRLGDAPITLLADTQAILDEITGGQGAVLYRGATQWQALPAGTPGQVLGTQGPEQDVLWVNQTGGGGGGGGSGSWFTGGRSGDTSLDTGAFATKGISLTPYEDMSVESLHALIDPDSTAQTFVGSIVTLADPSLSTTVSAVLGTTAPVQAERNTPYWVRMVFDAPIELTAGVTYTLLVSLSNATGTTALRVGSINSLSEFDQPDEGGPYTWFRGSGNHTGHEIASSTVAVGSSTTRQFEFFAIYPTGTFGSGGGGGGGGNLVVGPIPVTLSQGLLYVDQNSKDASMLRTDGTRCDFYIDDQKRLVTEIFSAILEREDGQGVLTL